MTVHPILTDPTINVTYDDILAMDNKQFHAYITHMREVLRRLWDEQRIPPARGWDQWEVTDEFKKLADFPVHKFWQVDELTGRRCIQNGNTAGNSVNAWMLDQMLRTRINYTEKDNGRSIYDFFSKDELFKRYLPYARRHFLRDSFYFFAQSVGHHAALPHRPEVTPGSPVDYCRAFAKHERQYGTHELLIEPKKTDMVYTGYAGHLFTDAKLTNTFWALSYDEVLELAKDGTLPKVCLRIVRSKELSREYAFHIRLYEKGQHIFPRMFSSFRVSVCQFAVNFPPLTAKLLYDTYLQGASGRAIVWDPSAGWGGRLLGALSSQRELHYIGTDPNSAIQQRYADIAAFYNNIRSGQSLFGEHNTSEVIESGSETFHEHDTFKRYAGTGDLVFTSGPYFNREFYSNDPGQSCVKFSSYDSWRDGFLRPTIRNAFDFLAPNRYFLWNIADLKLSNGTYLPLEADSMRFAQAQGFQYIETLLMSLRSMPGANRLTAEGATAKNQLRLNGKIAKFEPIHVFLKPPC